MALNKKNKTTLFPETFKVEGNKVVLFFFIRGPGTELRPFHHFMSMFYTQAAIDSCGQL